MKICIDCGLNKPLRDFHKNVARKDGRVSYCKPCTRARTNKWRADNPEQQRASVVSFASCGIPVAFADLR